MRILTLGSLNVDYVYRVQHIVRPGETISSETLSRFPGGKGANQSTAIARAGGEVWHAGTIGRDDAWMVDLLADSGVHVDHVRLYDGPSGHAIIQVDDHGENSILLFGGGNRQIDRTHIDLVLEQFESGDLLVLQNEVSEVPYAIEAAAARGLRICLNPAPFSPDILDWPLEKVSILVANMTEARELVGHDAPAEELLKILTRRLPSTEVVITVGAEGSYFGLGETVGHCPARQVTVVDSTAAGDTYCGYYLVSRARGDDWEEAMAWSTRAAAVCVSRPGAMSSIPRAEEI